jgi:hypothetical protein
MKMSLFARAFLNFTARATERNRYRFILISASGKNRVNTSSATPNSFSLSKEFDPIIQTTAQAPFFSLVLLLPVLSRNSSSSASRPHDGRNKHRKYFLGSPWIYHNINYLLLNQQEREAFGR